MMNKYAFVFMTMLLAVAHGDTPPPGTVKSKMFTGDGLTGLTATGSALNVNVTNSSGGGTVNQGSPGSLPWLVDGSAHTQPVSGALTCNAGSGTLLVDGSAHAQPVTGTFFQATQPVSGTLTCNAGTGTQTVTGNVGIVGTVPVSGTFYQATQPVSGSVAVNNFPSTQPVSGTVGIAGTVPVSFTGSVGIGGTVSVNNFPSTQAVTGTFFQATQPVSLLSLPSLAAGSANIGNVGIIGTVPISGSITATNSANGTPGSAIPSQANLVGGSDGTNLRALKVSAAGVLSVDGSAVTQPISGTVTVNAGTNLNTSALALETGGHLASIDTKTPSLGQALSASSAPVVLPAAQITALTPPTTVTVTQATGTNLHAVIDSGSVGIVGTVPVSVASLPLPASAATSALQTTGNTSLASIDTKLTSPLTVTGSVGIGGTVSVSNFPASQAVTGTFWQTTQPVSAAALPLPAGASTSALQTTGNTSLAAISGQLPATLGAKATAASMAVNIASDQVIPTKAPVNASATLSARQTVTSTETNLSAPSNAVGVMLECESVNADNLRWGFSNAATAILSSTLGMLCEPGRDSGFLPLGVGSVLHMISTGAGSDFMDVQWVLAQ